jgi:hypothetical protein
MSALRELRAAQKFSDQDLRHCLDLGLTPPEIARRFGCTVQAVHQRLKHPRFTQHASPALAGQPACRGPLDTMAELRSYVDRVNRMLAACDAYLQDPDDPSHYTLDARAEEVSVIYTVEVDGREERRRAPLSQLLGQVKEHTGIRFVTVRRPSPSDLLLKTVREGRSTLATAVQLARHLVDGQSMLAFREMVMAGIAEADPQAAARIAQAVRDSLVLLNAVKLPDALPVSEKNSR